MQRVREIELRIAEQNPTQERAQEFNRADFEQLAADLESVWKHPDADAQLKKRIVRTLIHEVVVDIDPQAGEVILIIHWKGGVHCEVRLPRRRRGQNASHTPPEVLDAVRALVRICTDEVIAGVLNRNAIPTGRGNRWTRERVTALRSHHKIACYDANRCGDEGWMNLTHAARFMKVSPKTLRLAAERGEITAEHPLHDGPWIFNCEVLRSQAAAGLLERARSHQRHPAIPIQQNDLFDLSTT